MKCTLTRDDIPLLSQWIKNSTSRNLSNFWPARKDSNLRPSESESDALSSCATGRYRCVRISVADSIIPHFFSECNQISKFFRKRKNFYGRKLDTAGIIPILRGNIEKERIYQKKRKIFKKRLDKKFNFCYNSVCQCNGVSPSGKATDSDSVIT